MIGRWKGTDCAGFVEAENRPKEHTKRQFMDTRKIKDRAERKRLKREARKKRPAEPKQTEPRGSLKPKVKKKGPGAPTRR